MHLQAGKAFVFLPAVNLSTAFDIKNHDATL